MLKITKNSNLNKIASEITCNSELFGDEVMNVEAQLKDALVSAEEIGCEITAAINNMWGGKVWIVAIPSVRKHHWVF